MASFIRVGGQDGAQAGLQLAGAHHGVDTRQLTLKHCAA
jgi:hypothetical protein